VISRIANPKQRSEELKLLEGHPGSAEVYPATLPAAPRESPENESSVAQLVARASERIGTREERIRARYRPVPEVRPSGAGEEAPLAATGAAGGGEPPAAGGPAGTGAVGIRSAGAVHSDGGRASPSGSRFAAAREAALAFGSAVHRLLEAADLHAVPEDLADLAALCAADSGIPGRGPDVLAEAARALRSPAIERARSSPRIHREVPFLADLEGIAGIVPGKIDLVYQTGDGFGIVDYKTDRLTAGEVAERALAHEPQVRLYARAIAKITGRPVRSAVLVFTALGVEREVALG
jgi:hypothetical protein